MDKSPSLLAGIVKRIVQVSLHLCLMALILFVSSGKLGWGQGWAYAGAAAGVLAVTSLVLVRVNPDLVVERTRVGEGTKGWDKVLTATYGLLGLVILVVAGLDERYGWSAGIPTAVQTGALVIFVLADLLASWALWTNAYFATTVRIQEERGHRVTTGGPYRFVRHPAYIGWLLCSLVTPLALDSLWALIPAVLNAGVIIARTALEDRMLLAELDGYQAFARKTRYRLLPGVW